MPQSQVSPLDKRQAAADLQRAFAAEQREALDEAENIYAGIIQRYPDFADAWHFYGLLLHRRKQSQKGLGALHRAHQLSPDNPLFLFNVSQVLMDTGDVEQGLACIERAHELDPDHGQIFMRYAQSMIERGPPEIILPKIQSHLEKSPESWHLWGLAGRWRERAGDFQGAVKAYKKAEEYAPANDPTPKVQLGSLYRSYDQPAEAKKYFNAALEIDPDCAQAHTGMANILAQEGKFEEAKTLCRKAMQLSPEAYGCWGLMARIHGKKEAPELIPELVRVEQEAQQNLRNASPIYFALGKFHEDTGDYDQAFENYKKANDLVAQFRPYMRETEDVITEDICAQLDETFIARSESVGVTGSGAVFVCGMPRSGTTLLETIVGSHPAVSMGGEMRFLADWMTRKKLSLAPPEKEKVGSWLAAAPDDLLKELALTWHGRMRELAGPNPLITDKMPDNFRNLGLIATCLPDARIIYVHRDARDNCFSCYATPFARGHNYSNTLDSLGHYYRQHERLVTHWKKVLPESKILDVTYEDLIADPEAQIRRIIDYLGLPWDARCLTPNKTERVVATASVHQVRQPIYSSSIGRWRRFEKYLGPLVAALGRT